MAKRDHKVETWDDNGQPNTPTMATEEEARAAETNNLKDGSGVSITRVTPPR